MTVFVDDMYLYPLGTLGRMKMSHMIADSTDELLAMADQIGVARRWLQHTGTPKEHFDVSMDKREKAIALGAVPITMEELARKVSERRVDPIPQEPPTCGRYVWCSLPMHHDEDCIPQEPAE